MEAKVTGPVIQGARAMFKPLSKIGFGTYRISSKVATHKAALKYALEKGIRVIDTSSNYGDGESEELIGEVLEEFIRDKVIKRDDVQIISKFGYFSGSNLARFDVVHNHFPEIVEFNPHLMHCIHPTFIKDQLTQSLLRLRMSHIDCYLLHNPEYYLTKNISKFGPVEGENISLVREEMLRRIGMSFECLEKEIKETKSIKFYGISSNSFGLPPCDPHFLPYEGLIALAEQAAYKVYGNTSEHHFAVMQLPVNLIETEGFSNAIDWAYKNHLAVVTNRPLNAFSEKGSWRLADYPDAIQSFQSYSESLKQELTEKKFHRVLEAMEQGEKCVLGQFGMSLFEWESYLEGHILPTIRKCALEEQANACHKAVEKLQEWLELLNSAGKHKSGIHSREFLINKLHYKIPEQEKLQKFALESILKYPGVSCVIVGARTKEYVDDVIDLI